MFDQAVGGRPGRRRDRFAVSTSGCPVCDGLAHTIVETLDFKDDDTLVAFTHGRGVFVTQLEPCAGPPIPTVSQWGLMCMTLLVIASAAVIFRSGGMIHLSRPSTGEDSPQRKTSDNQAACESVDDPAEYAVGRLE